MSNRESAILILFSLLIICMLFTPDTRTSLKNIFKSLVVLFKEPALKLFVCYQVFSICILCITIHIYKINLWMIKDYLLVMVFAILPAIVKIKNTESTIAVKKEVLNSFTIAGILAFITDQYNFSVIFELVLNLILIVLVLFQVTLQRSEEDDLSTFFNVLLSILGLFIIIHSVIGLANDLSKGNNFPILIEYLSEFIFWLLNMPLLFAWQYIGQFDVMENFLSHKKTSLSILKKFFQQLLKKYRFRNLKIDSNIVTNIQLGGLAKRCYLITINNDYQNKDVSTILLLFSIGNAPNCLYRQNNVDKVIPFKVSIIDKDNRQFIKSWTTPDIADEYEELLLD